MKVASLGVIFGILAALFIGSVKAQEHHGHPPQDMEIHQRFYSTWMMPDAPRVSCCHDEDCSPAESRYENGQWLARKVDDDGPFTPVPPNKVEQNRDTPDGRSHICGRKSWSGFSVFCFIPGAGG